MSDCEKRVNGEIRYTMQAFVLAFTNDYTKKLSHGYGMPLLKSMLCRGERMALSLAAIPLSGLQTGLSALEVNLNDRQFSCGLWTKNQNESK